jgi:SAM-dependent methyltransferase
MDEAFLDFPFKPEHFRRFDESHDELFYVQPRFVVHIDEDAIAAVTRLYRELLPEGGKVLDLMSSWRSHLPQDVRYEEVVGLGLNAEEMADNPQLSRYVVWNLTTSPSLPFEDACFDGAVCTVSVQYLTHPIEVFRDVGRVLKPGSPFAVTFSNRCFPTKAVWIWQAGDDESHRRLVQAYFHQSGAFDAPVARVRTTGRWPGSDPLYAVWAYRR